ncbi:hypothetical protein OJ997_23155 [Solirubrobacter phytolaccae]|uniref:Nuclear transport factor 2 family protein n=1 Tax=Solirubrobacter phytolaccae TaxID=1404360 RepID=A0A9X3SA35_9ACTN|nr:hypothetical protein [Solirubrobacter phytolaccae]MDA0183228.1 hypothetical protein [Solirubrobacter phytolaccae]
MITRKGLLTGGAAAGAAALATASPALAHGDDDELVGSWYGRVTADDPALGSFEELISFHRDGIVTDAHRLYLPATPFGPLLETSGHGAWKSVRGGYTAFFRFLLQQAPPSAGAAVGTDNVRLNFRVQRGRISGRFESQIKDTSGALVFTATGAIVAERITA